ncbi:MAG: DUF2085 domain-containing protein, partial [Candidatus Heimdallarchaeota archaeon]
MNEIDQESEKKNYLRLIFLNLLISAFIIITYVYIAETLGSISSFFINTQNLLIRFNFTLFLFTFFSVLAGSIHGLIDGFLAELIYQVAFYHEVYIEWCLIVAILGSLAGVYKYKPLKYHEGIKVYYTFVVLVIISFIITGFIILFQPLFYPNQFNAEIIIVNYGFNFFLQSLTSIIFLVPIFLVLYDKAFASTEKHIYYIWFTHHPISASDHTFYLKFGRTKIYFCSRCSGVILGGLIAMFLTNMLENIYQIEFSSEIALILIIVLPIPGIIDWGTQRLFLRKSTTQSRLLTGFIIGMALHLMSFTYKYYIFTILILISYFSIFG